MLEAMLNGSLVEVSSLDAEWLLDFAAAAAAAAADADAEVRERQAGRAKLRAAAQWCVLHPATVESGFVTWSDTGLPGLCPEDAAAGWGGDAAGGRVHSRAVRGRARGIDPDRAAVVGRRPGPDPPAPPDRSSRRSPRPSPATWSHRGHHPRPAELSLDKPGHQPGDPGMPTGTAPNQPQSQTKTRRAAATHPGEGWFSASLLFWRLETATLQRASACTEFSG